MFDAFDIDSRCVRTKCIRWMGGMGTKLAFRLAFVVSSTYKDKKSCFVDENKDSPSLVIVVTCPTLCPLQCLLLELSWLCQLTQVYVTNFNHAIQKKSPICNVIFM